MDRPCTRCGQSCDDDEAKFCPHCGAGLDRAVGAVPSLIDAPAAASPPLGDATRGARCALHPDAAAETVCTRCGAFACTACLRTDLNGRPVCQSCALRTSVIRWDVPWERRSELGLFRAYWETAKQGAFEPQKYITGLSPDGASWWDPASFATVSIVISLVMMLGIYLLVFGGVAIFGREELFKAASTAVVAGIAVGIAVAAIIGLPLAALARTFVGSGVDHLGLLLLGGGKSGFWATYRAYCYAMVPAMFGLIPGCGGYIWEIWRLVLSIVAYKSVHKMSGIRAAVAALIPVGLCCGGYVAIMAMAAFLGPHSH